MASHEKEGTLPYFVHKSAVGPLCGHPVSLGLSKRQKGRKIQGKKGWKAGRCWGKLKELPLCWGEAED